MKYDELLKAEEAYDKVERKFTSGNDTEVERAVITKEEWELAKRHITLMEYEKYF